jgi:arginase
MKIAFFTICKCTKMRDLCILEFPSNLGLREPSPGKEPGVKRLPHWLREHGFYQLLKPSKVDRLAPPPYSMHLDQLSGVRNADAIARYAEEQADLVIKILSTAAFPLVVGGDCSILIGNALALKKTGRFGLFFLDGHTDFVWPALSQTGGAAGMDLALVTGHGHEKLTDIDGLKPYITEEHVWCVGNRAYDDAYVKAIRDSSVHYTSLDVLRQEGIAPCIAGFLKMVREKDLDGFWIHIDVDVLNDDLMPAVDSRQPDGLTYEEFGEVLRLLLADAKATGVEITILDPDLDPDGRYTEAFVRNFCAAFTGAQ